MMERQYKDSGIEWIGRIPEEWKTSEVKRIMRNKSIKNKPTAIVLSLYRDYGIVPKDSRGDNHNVTSEDTTTYKYVEVGDFVINKMKAWQGSMAVSDYEGIISPAYYVCSFTDNELDRKYIHYLLRNEAYKPEYLRLSTGLRVDQWDLGIDDFMKIPIILPPLPEQQRIASYLDKKCGEIDELIALQEKMIAQLTEYKQAVITEAVTKGLAPNAKLVPSGIDWIGDVPEGWKVVKLSFLTSKIGSGSTPTGGASVYVQEGVKFLRSQNVHFEGLDLSDVAHISEEIDEEMKGTRVKAGDILLNITGGSIGRCYYVDSSLGRANVNQHVSIIRPSKIETFYLKYYLQSFAGQNQVSLLQTGGNREGLSAAALGNFKILLPPLPEQQRIAAFLDTKCSEIDSLIALKRKKMEALRDYKKSVIYEAVTGKTII